MKKIIASAATAFLIVAGSVLGTTAANAEEQPVCTPSEAWTEIVADIEHPAVTEVIEHDAVTETVEHPAVTETVEHPAVTHTVDHPAIYETVIVKPAVPEVKELSHMEFQWKWWGYVNHGQTVWTDGSYPTENPNKWAGEWKLNGKERKVVDRAYSPAVPAVTEERLVKAAWTETVVDQEAWTETIVLEEAYTEVVVITEAWTETVVIKEAYTEVVPDIEHPAVECPVVEPPVEEPPVEEPPVVVPPVVTPEVPVVTPVVVVPTTPIAAAPAAVTPVAVNSEKELAYTGGEDMIPFALGAGVLLLAGMGGLLARRRMQSN